ncbi:MAG TPA: DUF3307 domain-containing protein [Flavisolibacter sp.]|jgi:hypothetical protein|nr:DUF3307 domain-containing protein [Flavisolibacter sp.]
MGLVFLLKLVFAHLTTDFILQPRRWVEHRNQRHFGSVYLYVHGLITAALAYFLIGWSHWIVALIILITHTLIDGWKSYRKETLGYFLLDQLFHILILLGCWAFLYTEKGAVISYWKSFSNNPAVWMIATAWIVLTLPAGILIGKLTQKWREQLPDAEGLNDAGKWIGIMERSLIFFLVLLGKWEAIGLLIAAKGLLRFNESNRPEIKTEYLLIGTLISLSMAILSGFIVSQFL